MPLLAGRATPGGSRANCTRYLGHSAILIFQSTDFENYDTVETGVGRYGSFESMLSVRVTESWRTPAGDGLNARSSDPSRQLGNTGSPVILKVKYGTVVTLAFLVCGVSLFDAQSILSDDGKAVISLSMVASMIWSWSIWPRIGKTRCHPRPSDTRFRTSCGVDQCMYWSVRIDFDSQ